MEEDYLTKQEALHERDENGELLPIEVTLKLKKPKKVLILPMTRGEIKRHRTDAILNKNENGEVVTDKDFDIELIKKKCVKPKFSDNDFKYLKPYIVNALVNAIFEVSGLIEMNNFEKEIPKEELELKKNLKTKD